MPVTLQPGEKFQGTMMNSPIRLSAIVARGRNNVIGRDGDLPWRLRDDLKHFKQITSGAPLIMGRKTWESLPRRPLPGRPHLVLTRDWTYEAPGARVYSHLSPAISVARTMAAQSGRDDVFIIGGAALFADSFPKLDRLYLTDVDAAPEGDVYLSGFDEADWVETGRAAYPAGDGNDHAFVLRTLDRISPA